MKQTITAKLKLKTTPEQFIVLRKTQLAYRDGLNFVSEWSFANGKTSNQDKLQKACYETIRARFQLPAQMACNIPRQVGSTYKGLWTKTKDNVKALKAGFTKKCYKGLDKAAKYVSPTLTYSYGRDYGFKQAQSVSLLTLDGRIVVRYEGYDRHLDLIKEGKKIPERQVKGNMIGAAKLWYDKPKQQFYLLVSLAIEKPDAQPSDHQQVIGVDVGRRYLAVATNTKDETKFFAGKAIVHKANHYARLRKRLQQKGTRNAKRRILTIGQRERRLKLDANHVVSKRIIERFSNATIGIEELTGIRERTKRKHGKRASKQQRKANAAQSKWAFAELHALLAYKATLANSMVIKVEANYTSKACPKCGNTSDKNRPNNGLRFACENCGYTLHADLIGARNIALRALLVRQDWARTGVLSLRPDGSDREAKAERLQRYSELRWNPVPTSPHL